MMTFLSRESYFRSFELFWFGIVNGFDLVNWSVSFPRGNQLKIKILYQKFYKNIFIAKDNKRIPRSCKLGKKKN